MLLSLELKLRKKNKFLTYFNKEYIQITVVFGDYIDPIFKKCKFNSWMIRYNELMRIYNSEKTI